MAYAKAPLIITKAPKAQLSCRYSSSLCTAMASFLLTQRSLVRNLHGAKLFFLLLSFHLSSIVSQFSNNVFCVTITIITRKFTLIWNLGHAVPISFCHTVPVFWIFFSFSESLAARDVWHTVWHTFLKHTFLCSSLFFFVLLWYYILLQYETSILNWCFIWSWGGQEALKKEHMGYSTPFLYPQSNLCTIPPFLYVHPWMIYSRTPLTIVGNVVFILDLWGFQIRKVKNDHILTVGESDCCFR